MRFPRRAERTPQPARCRDRDPLARRRSIPMQHGCYSHALDVRQAPQLSAAEGPAVHREHVSNIRAALEWTFSAQGDLDLGTALAAASAPLFLEISLLSECRVWMERSIAGGDAAGGAGRGERETRAALALSLIFTEGDWGEVRAALIRGIAPAEELRYPRLQLRLLGALHIFLTRIGDFHGALAFA